MDFMTEIILLQELIYVRVNLKIFACIFVVCWLSIHYVQAHHSIMMPKPELHTYNHYLLIVFFVSIMLCNRLTQLTIVFTISRGLFYRKLYVV